MNTEQMNAIVRERANDLMQHPQIQEMYQSKATEQDAKDWLMHTALFTLMYSHEERMAMQLPNA